MSLYPTTVDQLMAVADATRVMPPKSTWFEPKLLSSLWVHTLDAAKREYLDYLRALERRLVRGALVVADNTKISRRELREYLAYVRTGGRYESRERDFGEDAMEVSRLLGWSSASC